MAKRKRGVNLIADFDEKDFVNNVYENKYILVIGSEVILNKDLEEFQKCQCDGDINKYIVSTLNHTDIQYDKISQILADDITTNKNVRDRIESLDYDLKNVSPELLAFLSTKLFKFVITTTIDHYLDAIMDKVWGKGNWQSCSIFNQDQLQDLQNQIVNKRIKPTLFYLFGQSGKNPIRSRFVATENDAIKLIANNWISNSEDEGKTNISVLKQYISNKRLLALGCKFDDWYFRFFWYSLKGGLQGHDPRGKLADGEVAISWRDTESDDNLKRYLDNTNYVSILPDARSFMKEMSTKLMSLDSGSPLRNIIMKNRHMEGIFLSYHGPDFLQAFNIFQTLCKNNYNVWFDNVKLYSGDKYNDEIQNAIAQCKIFMPVISDKVKSNLQNTNLTAAAEPYFLKEWRWARQNKRTVMPIGINDAGKAGFELFNNYFFGDKNEHEDEYLTGTDLTKIGAWKDLLKKLDDEYDTNNDLSITT